MTTDRRRETLNPKYDTVLSRMIRERRQAMGWSQSKLAEVLEVHTSYISRIESGTRLPSVDLVTDLAWVMEIPIADLALAVHGLDPEIIRADIVVNARQSIRAELIALLTGEGDA